MAVQEVFYSENNSANIFMTTCLPSVEPGGCGTGRGRSGCGMGRGRSSCSQYRSSMNNVNIPPSPTTEKKAYAPPIFDFMGLMSGGNKGLGTTPTNTNKIISGKTAHAPVQDFYANFIAPAAQQTAMKSSGKKAHAAPLDFMFTHMSAQTSPGRFISSGPTIQGKINWDGQQFQFCDMRKTSNRIIVKIEWP